jgi:hypothetical protein
MKICPVGAELFHVNAQIDRQTDMEKLIVAFHNIANMPKSTYRIFVGKFEGKTPHVKTQAHKGGHYNEYYRNRAWTELILLRIGISGRLL